MVAEERVTSPRKTRNTRNIAGSESNSPETRPASRPPGGGDASDVAGDPVVPAATAGVREISGGAPAPPPPRRWWWRFADGPIVPA